MVDFIIHFPSVSKHNIILLTPNFVLINRSLKKENGNNCVIVQVGIILNTLIVGFCMTNLTLCRQYVNK